MKLLFWLVVIGALIWLFRRAFVARPGMSVDEAARLLEVARNASADEIQAAHRRLIARVHPDAGGTAELAARINQARDVLLRQTPPA